jgi:AraC-like DNA-binding protein
MIFNDKNRIWINSLGKHFCKGDWVWDVRNNQFSDFDLWFVIEGKGQMVVNGLEYNLQGGDCFLFRPGMKLYANNDYDEPLIVINAHFAVLDINENVVQTDTISLPQLYRKVSDPVFFVNLLHHMLDCFYRNDRVGAEIWLTAALLEMSFPDISTAPLQTFSRTSEYIRQLYTKINERPGIEYSLKKLSVKAGYSPAHFSRLFKQHTGLSFRESITSARIKQSEYLLASTQYPINQIAAIIGCPDIFLFSKMFKKHTGTPPSEYRKTIRGRNVARMA